jgi:predicted nucleic acid-binding protein
MTLLDTTFLIDLMKGKQEAVEKLKKMESEMIPIFVSTPTIFELWTGIMATQKSDKEKQKVIEVLSSINNLDLDLESAKVAGEINGTLLKKGEMIDPEDCMIAGIAKTNNESILTRNTQHFGRIKGIKIETY